MIENGFHIRESKGHGKNVKRQKKTSTIQVYEDWGNAILIREQFRFVVGNTNSKINAMVKAVEFAKTLKPFGSSK